MHPFSRTNRKYSSQITEWKVKDVATRWGRPSMTTSGYVSQCRDECKLNVTNLRILPGMGLIELATGSPEVGTRGERCPTMTQPWNGLHKYVLIRWLFNPLRVESTGDALAPRVCLRHYPRITGWIPLSGIYGSGTKVSDIAWKQAWIHHS